MSSASLTQLYYESARTSSAPFIWIGCSVAVHLGLVFLPIGKHSANQQHIAFDQGDAGVQVELVSDPAPARESEKSDAPPTVANQLIDEVEPPTPTAESDEPAFVEPVRQRPAPNIRKSTLFAMRSTTAPRESGAGASHAGSAAVQPAAQIFTTQPPYPADAREIGAQGTVKLRVRVGADGTARAVEIARSSGRADFDGNSLSTVKRDWRFRAARGAGGAPVESTVLVTIRFELNS